MLWEVPGWVWLALIAAVALALYLNARHGEQKGVDPLYAVTLGETLALPRRRPQSSSTPIPSSDRYARSRSTERTPFAGSHGGAEHWAVVASLIEMCKLDDVEPLSYLADVLARIVNGHPNNEIDELLP